MNSSDSEGNSPANHESSQMICETSFVPGGDESVKARMMYLLRNMPSTAGFDGVSSDDEISGEDEIPSDDEDLQEHNQRAGKIFMLQVKDFMIWTQEKFIFENLVTVLEGDSSGATSVLNAISVGLGSTSFTGSAKTSAESFVRYKQKKAKIVISIDNDGENAYEPLKFSKRIDVYTEISRDGVFEYMIRGVRGTRAKQSLTREGLNAINEHFRFFIDNPLCVFPSHNSFLESHSNKTRLEIFMKGTNSEAIIDDLEVLAKQIDVIGQELGRRENNIHALSSNVQRLESIYTKVLGLVDSSTSILSSEGLKDIVSDVMSMQEHIGDSSLHMFGTSEVVSDFAVDDEGLEAHLVSKSSETSSRALVERIQSLRYIIKSSKRNHGYVQNYLEYTSCGGFQLSQSVSVLSEVGNMNQGREETMNFASRTNEQTISKNQKEAALSELITHLITSSEEAKARRIRIMADICELRGNLDKLGRNYAELIMELNRLMFTECSAIRKRSRKVSRSFKQLVGPDCQTDGLDVNTRERGLFFLEPSLNTNYALWGNRWANFLFIISVRKFCEPGFLALDMLADAFTETQAGAFKHLIEESKSSGTQLFINTKKCTFGMRQIIENTENAAIQHLPEL